MTGMLARLTTSLADRYRIEREIGAGGMATVYLAHDVRHDRKVALKVLKPELSAILGAERFLHEIKTTANLQHPHILGLFDSGVAQVESPEFRGVDGGSTPLNSQLLTMVYYVMPYVEGESLRDRLNREKQLPVEDAVRIAREVADALNYAHEHGVVHRDIKPENILLHGGHAQVADFGIALAASRSDGGSRMTETGMSLGTPHYMSPEQAMGEREITPRSDIYALGCVLYEMLTAEPPFVGATAQAIIARVLTEEPRSLTLQRRTIPPHVEGAVRRALEKLPADRFATAAEFGKALGDTSFVGTGFGPTGTRAMAAARPASRQATWVLRGSVAAAMLFAALAAWGWFRPAALKPVIRYSMGFPADQVVRQGLAGINIAISPDGRRIVYVGPGEGGDQLWLRERDRLSATPIPGTTGAATPFFSPDGSKIGFNVGSAVAAVPVGGGPPVRLIESGEAGTGGAAWGINGYIYSDSRHGIVRIPAEGGSPELVVPYDTARTEIGFAWPEVLPNGKGLIYRVRRNLDPTDFEIGTFDFATGERHILAKGLLARYVAPGYLVLLRHDGAVLAAPFDQEKMVLTGAAVPLFDGVATKSFGGADFAISRSGTLVYLPTLAGSVTGNFEIVMVGRDGSATALAPPLTYNAGANHALALSPDGRRLALEVIGTASPDIWVRELPAGALTRLTFDARLAQRATWSPDGRYVLYLSTQTNDIVEVWRRKADGSAAAERVFGVPGLSILEASLSRSGEWLVYRTVGDSGNRDIFAVRLGRDSIPTPLLTTRYAEQGAVLSPSGRWLAYISNESGRNEIYVRPFPRVNDGRWQISTDGGVAARWTHSGRELVYENLAGELMTSPVREAPGFQNGTAQRLLPAGVRMLPSVIVPFWDFTPDDRHLVMARLTTAAVSPGGGQIVVADNWFTELYARMGAH